MTVEDFMKMRLVPKSIVGGCVGHHPDRCIYRKVQMFDRDRIIRAHHLTVICSEDRCTKGID